MIFYVKTRTGGKLWLVATIIMVSGDFQIFFHVFVIYNWKEGLPRYILVNEQK